MPCLLSIGRIQPILAKSTSLQYRWIIKHPTLNLQPRSLSTSTSTSTTLWQRQPSLSKSLMTTLLVGSSGGMAMYYYYYYNNNNTSNSINNSNRHYSSLQSLWRMGRAALVGMQVAADYQWWYISVRYLHRRSMDAEHAERLKQSCHLRSARRVLKAMQDLGGIYIKLGQHMSAMHYILPDPWTSTLAVLQDQCPVVSTQAELEHMFWEETGKRIDQVFAFVDFDHPLGVASLAQVHQAIAFDNSGGGDMVVAVKFQHPSIETYCRLDLQCVTAVVSAIQWLFPDFGFGWLVDEMNEALPLELDFTNEAKNADRVWDNFKDDPGALVVPNVVFATRRLLCMEYIEGARPDDLEYMKIHNIDPVQVSTEITTIFSKMMFIHGFVHCDPHPGNLLIRPSSNNNKNFDVVLLDHGQYRTLSQDFRTDYAHLWTSLIRGDENGIEKYAYKLGCRPPHHRLFASLLTGREWHTIVSSQGLATPRTSKETDRVAGRTNLFLHKIAELLSTLPRVMLLMLKTFDLLRHLDTSLSGGGGKRKYGTMVQCCNEAVWLDARQRLWDRYDSEMESCWWWIGWCRDYLVAWWDYSSLDWAIWWTL